MSHANREPWDQAYQAIRSLAGDLRRNVSTHADVASRVDVYAYVCGSADAALRYSAHIADELDRVAEELRQRSETETKPAARDAA